MNAKILKLTGDNFEIGRGLGKFWGKYFSNLGKKSKLYLKYKKWLRDDQISEGHGKLLANMTQHFPALFQELVGMNVGVNESQLGFKVSLYGLFTCWLAETDLSFGEYNGCSSVLLPIKNNGFFLAHSDEDDERYPLVVTNVSLNKTANKTSHFISISHPFQLLGSAAGMNNNYAFQGNSIGCSKEIFDILQDTGQERIPKTVFTRMMLEMSSIDEIKALYRNYTSTLPNHHYVVFRDKAYSIEVRPFPKNELIKPELLKGYNIQIHTNHFLRNPSLKWEFRDNGVESRNRLTFLTNTMKNIELEKDVPNRFIDFLKKYPNRGKKLINKTSGAFFFTIMNGKPVSCEVKLFRDSKGFSVSINGNNVYYAKKNI